jgi:hydrogenase 3 maturation protease
VAGLRHRLAELLRTNTLVLGVGNSLRGDDGVGPEAVRRLAGRIGAPCIDAGPAPENYLEKVARAGPDTVVIVDAADFGGRPGEVALYGADRIAAGGLSTHASSLRLVADYLAHRCGARVYLLAVQPERADGVGLSDAAGAALDRLVGLFLALSPGPGGRASAAATTDV